MAVGEEKRIFMSAMEFRSPVERAEYLASACRGDAELRSAVDRLLLASSEQTCILDRPLGPAAELRQCVDGLLEQQEAAASHDPTVDRSGETVGAYHLLEKIGEGGFGQVYVAQQERPVRRRVAVKLLKPGMNSLGILARFEAERQALAMMDHPNIAQVFDAGTTPSGEPFFVMELVRGVPITRFCEAGELRIEDRLELFIDVCQAVQHAHQKGVIHRDLKPTNIMVTLHDAKPVAKVIDFGVAKAIGDPLTSHVIYTRFMELIGTPMYMSPEQAEMTAQDVDTRSDVFSLGMVLFELLTGTPPYDAQRLSTASFDELRRIIREESLPAPSRRLDSLGELRTSVSANRRVTLAALLAELRGDLDWIVLKATDKNRSRRYESASALAQDIRRHLDDEAIEARPPSRWYLFTKFAKRHRGPLTAGGLVVLAMVVGTTVSIWQAIRANAERSQKEVERKKAEDATKELAGFNERLIEANRLLAIGRAEEEASQWPEAAAAYARATQIQPTYYFVWMERAAFRVRVGLWTAAADDYSEAVRLEIPVTGSEWKGVPQLLLLANDHDGYDLLCQKMWHDSSKAAEGRSLQIIRSCLFVPKTPVPAGELTQSATDFMGRPGNSFGPPDRHRPGGPKGPPPRGGPKGPPPGGPGPGGRNRDPREPIGVQRYVVGLAHYREGHFEEALQYLLSALDDEGWGAKATALPVLAMTYAHLGRADEAAATLEKATITLDVWTQDTLAGKLGETPVPWFDMVELLLLHREATEIVTGNPPTAIDERLAKIADRASAAIR